MRWKEDKDKDKDNEAVETFKAVKALRRGEKMLRMFSISAVLAISTGCVVTAPCNVSWRSNSHSEYATTEGRNQMTAGKDTVNAEKTTNAEAAVNTSPVSNHEGNDE